MLTVRLEAAADIAAGPDPVALALPTTSAEASEAEATEAEATEAEAEAEADATEERPSPAQLLVSAPAGLDATLQAWLGDERRPEPPAKGNAGEVVALPLPGGSPAVVFLVGTGGGEEADWRKAGAGLVRAAANDTSVTLTVPADTEPDAVRGLIEGALLASYRFTLASDPKPAKLTELVLAVEDPARYEEAFGRADAIARGTALARDLTNMPSNIKSPEWFADQAVEAVGAEGVQTVVRDPAWLAENAFGGILAVGGGSTRGPRLLELRWAPEGAQRHIVLVGKGITFDTGGISIKPGPGMQLMKKDMGGGAAVVGTALAVAALELPIRLTVLVPLAENMPSGTAYRPGDVVRHYGGRTSEVFSTDAEGRMVLGDVLAYAAATLEPDVLIDLATLTGGQSVALGKRTAALFSDDDELAKALSVAAEEAGEKVWQMPLPEDYLEQIDSDWADANNSGGRGAQSATAALFLRPFTGAARAHWAHVDMSSPAWSDGPSDELTKGATGWGVRTLTRWLETQL